MTARVQPVYFQKVIQDSSLTRKGSMGDRAVYPIGGKLGRLRANESCLKTCKQSQSWMGSATDGMLKISDGITEMDKTFFHLPMGATAFITLPAGVGVGTGLANMYDAYRQFKRSGDIHDTVGQNLAAVDIAKNGLLTGGAGVVLGSKSFSMVQDLGLAFHHPVTITGGLATFQAALSWASGAIFGLYYAINTIRSCLDLVSWYQGRAWRAELLAGDNPGAVLYKELKDRVGKLEVTADMAEELALQAGARWIEKVEQASGGRLSIGDKRAAFKTYIVNNPQVIRDLIGNFGPKLTGKGELIRFGKYMAYQNECAKFEAECMRKLGRDAVEAMKAGDTEALKKALEFPEWVGPVIKIGFAVIGLAAVIAMTVFLTGSPMGVFLIVAGIAALAMIYISDAKELKEHLLSGEFKKRDRYFIYFTLALSVVAFAGVLAITIASGGMAPFVGSLILSAAWLGVNGYSAYSLWRYDHRRWEVQKMVDLRSYRKFLETNPTEEEIKRIKLKLSEKDREYINSLKNALEELRAREEEIQKAHEQEIDNLIEALKTNESVQ